MTNAHKKRKTNMGAVRWWRRSDDLAGAVPGELVCSLAGGGVLAHVGGQVRERALDLLPDPPERDAEHALAALQQVDDFVSGSARVHARAVAHQRDLGNIAGT